MNLMKYQKHEKIFSLIRKVDSIISKKGLTGKERYKVSILQKEHMQK